MGGVGSGFLLTKGSDYQWNAEISLSLDTEQMERLNREAEEAETDEEKIEKYMRAAALYAGSYMEGYDDMYWEAYLLCILSYNVPSDGEETCRAVRKS